MQGENLAAFHLSQRFPPVVGGLSSPETVTCFLETSLKYESPDTTVREGESALPMDSFKRQREGSEGGNPNDSMIPVTAVNTLCGPDPGLAP